MHLFDGEEGNFYINFTVPVAIAVSFHHKKFELSESALGINRTNVWRSYREVVSVLRQAFSVCSYKTKINIRTNSLDKNEIKCKIDVRIKENEVKTLD